MIKYSLFLLLSIVSLLANAQDAWQQSINYTISADLNVDEKQITGQLEATYFNNSPEVLDTLHIHLWANAFADKQSAYMKQAVKFGMLDVYFNNDNDGAGFKDLQITQDGTELAIEQYQGNADVVYVILKKGIQSGEKTKISMNYKLNLPKKFSRLGYDEQTIHLAHWYPRFAVYDTNGWNPLPYLGAGEFYGNYGNFDVSLTCSKNWILLSPFTRSKENLGDLVQYSINGSNIHDIAIFLHETFEVQERTIDIDGKTIKLSVLKDPMSKIWGRSLDYLESTLRFYSRHIGPYPYGQASIVQNGLSELGNMEYPAIATVSADTDESLDYYIAHEVGHFWFQGVIGFDERSNPWMDEGLTTYYEHRYTLEKHGKSYYDLTLPSYLQSVFESPFIETAVTNQICRHADQSMSTEIDDYARANYGINNYERAAMIFRYLASYLGEAVFDSAIQSFYQKYQYKHPSPADLQASLEAESGKDLTFIFKDYIKDNKTIDYAISKLKNQKAIITKKGEIQAPVLIRKQMKDGTFSDEWKLSNKESFVIRGSRDLEEIVLDPEAQSLDFNRANNYSKKGLPRIRFFKPVIGSKRQRDINIIPTLSLNSNDGLGLGLAAFNSTYPTKNWKYVLWPQYSLKSKRLTGQAWTSYSQYMNSELWHKWVYRIGLKSFSMDNSLDIGTNPSVDIFRRYVKVDPSVNFYFAKKRSSRSTTKISAEFIRLWEDVSVFSLGEFDGFRQLGSSIIRLGFHHKNESHLAPKQFSLVAEQATYESIFGENNSYFKLTGTTLQEYKYSTKHSVAIRLHGAAFIKNNQEDRSANVNDKGVLALLYQGFNDYAYDGYYLARYNQGSRYDNQISTLNGGGFKQAFGSARSSSLGQSQRYIMSANVSADLPIDLGMFKVKAFFDYGIYGQHILGTPSSIERRNLYSGGLSLDIANGALAFHLPILTSSEFSDIYNEEDINILGRITFSLNLHKYDIWKFADDKKL